MNRSRYIVVLGPDGSGKTTIADYLADQLSEEIPVRRMNFSFGVMPSVSRVLRRPPQKSIPEGMPSAGMVTPLGRAKALLLGVWYGLDHVLGHFVLRRAKSDEVFVFARSYHDFLYQRAYLNLPKAVPRLFLALGPKPDLVVTPLRDALAIHEAKPELTVAEITEQYGRITGRLARYPYFFGIDASAGVEQTARNIRSRVGL